jgi:O-antigen/teichoic acid export membrane protein
VVDQALSSASNALVSLYIAHTVGATEFGAFGLAYVTYGFVLNASRGLSTDPLMVRFSGVDIARWRDAVRNCTGTALVVGAAAGLVMLAACALLRGATSEAFLALGLTLPGLMLQDSWRYSFFALGRGGLACINDLLWVLALGVFIAVLRASGHADIFMLVAAWGLAANLAACVGMFQARVKPRLAGARSWLLTHRDLGPRYLAEGVSSSASGQLRSYGVSAILGLAAVGYVQASVTLIGPITITALGMSLVLIPEAARVVRSSPHRLRLFCLLSSAGLTAAAIAWGLILLVALPRGLGSWLLGPIWRPTYPLMLPTMAVIVGQGVGFGAAAGLHGLGASKRSLRAAAIQAVALVACSLIAAALWGAAGAIYGTAAAIWAGSLVYWWQLRRAMRDAGVNVTARPPLTSPARTSSQQTLTGESGTLG